MSSTNRGAQRRADDFYETPAWVTRAIVPYLALCACDTVLDPCAGRGALLRGIRAQVLPGSRVEFRGLELDADRAACCLAHGLDGVEVADALVAPWPAHRVCVMNPPFSLALEFVQRALDHADASGTVAALMRLAMLASQKRASFWRACPADVYVLPKRPSFTGDGRSDSADYAWFVWGPGRGGRWRVLDVAP